MSTKPYTDWTLADFAGLPDDEWDSLPREAVIRYNDLRCDANGWPRIQFVSQEEMDEVIASGAGRSILDLLSDDERAALDIEVAGGS